jgi:arsenite methyltransferase
LSCGSNLDFLKITPGENILDLGCGRGNETIQAAGDVESRPFDEATFDAVMSNCVINHARSKKKFIVVYPLSL